jgi:hypothetical protein
VTRHAGSLGHAGCRRLTAARPVCEQDLTEI